MMKRHQQAARPEAIRPGSVLLCLAALASVGCSHQVRTFFFTGVPEPGQQTAAAGPSDGEHRRPHERVRKNQFFEHGPYGAGACDLCHEVTGGSVSRQVAGATTAPSRGVTARLVQPANELCLGCHNDRHSPPGGRNALWVHGPVVNGQCTTCHSPHRSEQAYLLLKDSSMELCRQCHSADAYTQTPEHAANSDAECVRCHNAHAGQDRFLLRADYAELSRFDQG